MRVIYALVGDERFPRVHLVRHADLARDPPGQFAKLYDAFGLAFTDQAAGTAPMAQKARSPAA